jgi:hypothetical protein
MNWRKMYDYPTHLVKLHEGDIGLFVCKPAWRGRLGTVCAQWVRVNMDWRALGSPETLPKNDFWTCGHSRGLLVGRGSSQARNRARKPAKVFVVKPVTPKQGGPERIAKLIASWAGHQGPT